VNSSHNAVSSLLFFDPLANTPLDEARRIASNIAKLPVYLGTKLDHKSGG